MIEARHVRSLLLDIEGTTTPISFVYDTLFPYAANNVEEFLSDHLQDEAVQRDVRALRSQREIDLKRGMDAPTCSEQSEQQQIESVVSYARWLISRDSKFGPLKSLQGKVWEEGYLRGDLRGEVFEEVPRALERWRGRGLRTYIYSSGSVLAQRLLFGHSNHGDLAKLLDGFFDTSVGPKTEPKSYLRIAETIALEPSGIVFLSDAVKELDAARDAGFQTVLSVRPGNQPVATDEHPRIHNFDDLPL
ncbi:MAG: acireductone synthase [Acidobacteriaceae bacterium]